MMKTKKKLVFIICFWSLYKILWTKRWITKNGLRRIKGSFEDYTRYYKIFEICTKPGFSKIGCFRRLGAKNYRVRKTSVLSYTKSSWVYDKKKIKLVVFKEKFFQNFFEGSIAFLACSKRPNIKEKP